MAAHPDLVAGQGRLCTDLGQGTRGLAIAKVGADGIYCTALPKPGLGIALKVEDGDMRCAPPALLYVIRLLAAHHDLGFDPMALPPSVERHAEIPTLNTRGKVTGTLRVAGKPRFHA
jgi:L-asparaginase II